MRLTTSLLALIFLFPALSCIQENPPKQPEIPVAKTNSGPEYEFRVEDFFSADLADGFVWPVSTVNKEKTVVSTAKGMVVTIGSTPAFGKIICIEHHFVENARIRLVYSVYANLAEINVEMGDVIAQKQVIGKINKKPLRFTITEDSLLSKFYTEPDISDKPVKEFVKLHASTMIPVKEAYLLIAIKHEYKMQSFRYGKLLKTYGIALSQSPLGHKQVEGDNKLPEGEYRIIQKTKGPFAGDYAEYLGPRFMRLNYLNNYDAENALKNKKITAKQAAQIIASNTAKKEPNKYTGLGGGIGIHGWAGDWPVNSRHLTWGCISMKNDELTELFDVVPLYSQILIFP
jgi:hypothetical protein